MAILITGGAGYIGSHTLIQLIKNDYEVVVIDNLSNAQTEPLRRIEWLTGVKPTFYHGDIHDSILLRRIFNQHKIDAVVHFAGLKSVTESVSDPLRYYRNNISGTLALLEEMARFEVFRIVFSSSANVYGTPKAVPVTEDMPTSPTNPYGRTKLMSEEILNDLQKSDKRWSMAMLRYFNPVGAHESGMLGEDPKGLPNNIMPFISQVAVGLRPQLPVYGGDYDTPDGTGVRDYIHVVDLADAHISALEYLEHNTGFNTFNIGTGEGYSVLQLVDAFSRTAGVEIPYAIKERRPGDIGASWADPKRAKELMGWQANRNLEQMMQDTWRWQKSNPKGYIQKSAQNAEVVEWQP